MTATPAVSREAERSYAALEERVLARDQVGAAQVYYDLVRDERPVAEIIGRLTRIHAPYTHVPYHQRLDDGSVRFVNNDHCLLSSRASLRLMSAVSPALRHLPLAQTVWYVPTGLDPWNQLIGKAPGHYARMYDVNLGEVTRPEIHWPDQEPEYVDGTIDEQLNAWLTLVQRGEVLRAYRVFLGLLEDEANRERVLAQLGFAGLIDVQDRMLFNRSYTTGHKSFRARATIELGELVGWENAHDIVYAGVPDMAVGPRWHSTYEMAGNVVQTAFEGNDHDLLQNDAPLSKAEFEGLQDVLLKGVEPSWQYHLTDLLKAGKGPLQLLEAVQVVAAENILRTHDPRGFSMPQHAYEYCNTLRWYWGKFDHKHKLKLLYIAAGFVNRAAHHQANTPGNGLKKLKAPRGVKSMSQAELLRALQVALIALLPDESVALTDAYLRSSYDRAPLLELLGVAAAMMGNDPHNQELGMCMIEDYRQSTAAGRERLLLACAKHTANHRKYGDPLECFTRFTEAFSSAN